MPAIKAHLEVCLGRSLRQLGELSGDGPTHDLETLEGTTPVVAIEAKELVSKDFLETSSQVGRMGSFGSDILTLHWMVSFLEPTLGESHDPKMWVTTEQSRVSKLETRSLFRDLEPLLATLERFNIRKSRDRDMGTATSAEDEMTVHLARRMIDARVVGVCLASDPTSDRPPGIDLAFSYGYVRTGNPDAAAERIQSWLDGPLSENLTVSLARAAANERHAALWLESDPETWSAEEQGLAFVPTVGLNLPKPIDVLWAFIPPVVWRYDGDWSAALINPSANPLFSAT